MNALHELKSFIEKVNKHPEHIENEKDRVFQFDLTDAGSIQVQFKDGRAHLYDEVSTEADVVLKLSEKHLLKLLADDLNTTMAFMTGQLKVDGKMGLALNPNTK